MGTPIINPWLFYRLHVLGGIRSTIFFIMAGLAGFLIWRIISWPEREYYNDSKEALAVRVADAKSCVKKVLIAILTLNVLLTVLPSEKAVYKMYVAKFVTYENAQTATDKIDEYFNKLVNAMEKSKAKEKRG